MVRTSSTTSGCLHIINRDTKRSVTEIRRKVEQEALFTAILQLKTGEVVRNDESEICHEQCNGTYFAQNHNIEDVFENAKKEKARGTAKAFLQGCLESK